MERFDVTGMSCASCQAHVEKAVSAVEGVSSVAVSLISNTMNVEGNFKNDDIIKAVQRAGYNASLCNAGDENEKSGAKETYDFTDKTTPVLLKRLLLSLVFLLALMYITMGHNMLHFPLPGFLHENFIGLALVEMLLALIVMIINKKFFVSGFKSLFHGAPNMDSLVAMGSTVSFGWSLYILFLMTVIVRDGNSYSALSSIYHDKLYFESAAMIPALITVGKTLESYTKGHTADSLKSLLMASPKEAVVLRDGKELTVSADDLVTGDTIIIKPGATVPADGSVISGESSVDESLLTGESVPVFKGKGDRVSAATINGTGLLKVRAERVGDDTSYSEIIKLVRNASESKAPVARIADRVSLVFVPAVMLTALIVFLGWFISGSPVSKALEHAITVLVISCPCALGLATPLAIMAGTGAGARSGILFKNAEALEKAGKIKNVALDKTGTITKGTMSVTGVFPFEMDESEFLDMARTIERMSVHPLSDSIVKYADRKLGNVCPGDTSDFRSIPGKGLELNYMGSFIRSGSGRFISEETKIPESFLSKASEMEKSGNAFVYFSKDKKFAGAIALSDTIRDDSKEAIKLMKKSGIRTVMITGDNPRTASAVAAYAGVDDVISGVLPDGKEESVRDLMKSGITAMVGDGINDAPALKSSDVGIAIGAGTDVAIDSADVVLMNSSLIDAYGAIFIGKKTLKNIYENLFWAFFYNAALIPIAAGFWPNISISPMFGAAAMSISSVTVCLNALRLNRVKFKGSSEMRSDTEEDNEIKKGGENLSERYTRDSSEKSGRNNKSDSEKEEKQMTRITVKVNGMMCNMCEKHVRDALMKLDKVEDAACDHEKGMAVLTLSGDVSSDDIRAAVEGAGYEFGGKIQAVK